MIVSGADTYVAYFTKGLGDVATAEIRALAPQARTSEKAERFALVMLTRDAARRVGERSRTIDDLRVLVAGPATIRDEADLARLTVEAETATRSFLSDWDPGRSCVTPWSLTVSARTPVWRRRPTWDPAPVIAENLHGADFAGTSRQPVDLRLQVDRDIAHLSASLFAHPVGKHDDAPVWPGALRSTVAAALVRLAEDAADPAVLTEGIYDPFSGSGTIVAEATRQGLPVYASDIDAQAVALTRQRLVPLLRSSDDLEHDLRHRVFVHDVLRGPPPRVTASVVVSNLPWGKQVVLSRRGELFDAVAALVACGLGRGGSCALLTTHEDQLVARIRHHAREAKVGVRRIGLLGQTPAVVVAPKDAGA